MRICLKYLSVVATLVAFSGVANAAVETNVDRPGGDYTNVTLPSGSSPSSCEALCNADGVRCRAWTFVRANVQAANPRCWLKSSIPAARMNNCCVSGVTIPPIQSNVDRPGGDYTNVTLPSGSPPSSCEALCNADGDRCRAWTFVRANVQAPNPRCWLKNAVPAAQANNCCTSGVK